MDTFFRANDLSYAWIVLTLVLLDRLVLVRVLRPVTWYWLRLPAVILHELAHYVVALLLLATPRIVSLRPTPMPDGSVRLGRVEWGPPLMGDAGHVMARLAPVLWFPVAALAASALLAEPRGLFEGLGWALGIWLALEAGLLLSEDDLRGSGLFLGVFLAFLASFAVFNAFLHARVLLCGTFGITCGPLG